MVKCAACGRDLPESEMRKFTLHDTYTNKDKVYDVCKDDFNRVRASPYAYLKGLD